MTTGGSGAVFFLGTRAHYQVLQQPESRSYDVENGNASTETIYHNPTVQQTWSEQTNGQSEIENTYMSERANWNYCDNDASDDNRIDIGSGIKRRTKRRPSETALCERDNDMKPALLNALSSTPKLKSKPRRSPLSFLASLARRRRRQTEQQYLQHLESVLTTCTYKESCRCLECQSRYFECDDFDEESSEEDDFVPRLIAKTQHADIVSHRYSQCNDYDNEDDDDEVFVDTVPGDNTSTDLLLEDKKMSVSSDELEPSLEDEESMQLEVAAGTPVLLNYLLTHPITCSIQ